ncbi:pilus assembly protein TadG-related protein [Nocardioides sp. SYSU D00038]|uniref:pilus assembly protein TadG-related protein n=1 Tax=Nocardioides sp. SYSU D00038 TaxID=2812554 RepID=UPI0019686C4F|nr:pilus assembly protein TadG-related protein [Nocardioides sp. SYSU D00038]
MRAPARPRRDERGSVVPVVAAMVVGLVVVAAFAVDLGMQRVVRRDMQAVADVVALDLARHLDGRPAAALAPVMESQRTKSVAQQEGSALGDDLVVDYELGAVTDAGVFAPGVDPPTAVQVTARSGIDFALMPGRGNASRSAVGIADSNACFTIGSFAVGLNRAPGTLVALLNPLLGDTDLDVVGYQGLAAATVDLLGLVQSDHIGVGSVDELLALDDLTVADLMLAAADVLRDRGDATSVVQATVLEGLAQTSVVASTVIDVADVLALSTAGDAALIAELSVLDLIGGAVFVANGDHFAAVPGLDLNLPNLASTTQSLSIIEGPRLACGKRGATATTAQVRLDASGAVGTTVPVPLGGTIRIGGPLTVAVRTAEATGRLDEVTCSPDVVPVDVVTSLASLSVVTELGITGDNIGIGQANLLGIPLLTGLITADIHLGQTAESRLGQGANPGTTVTWTVPPDAYGSVKSVDGGDHVLPDATLRTTTALTISDIRIANVPLADVRLLGLPLGQAVQGLVVTTVNGVVNGLLGATGLITTTVANLLTTTVNPLIGRVNGLVGPLADALGLHLAGADVRVLAAAQCNQPVLRG